MKSQAKPNNLSPSVSLLTQQAQALAAFAPFSHMSVEHCLALLGAASEVYFAPDEVIFSPEQGVVHHICIIKQGQVNALADEGQQWPALHCEAGQMFPTTAALAGVAVRTRWVAATDTFCWQVPLAVVQQVAQQSVALAECLAQESRLLLQLSRKALQLAMSSEVFSRFSMERPLSELATKPPLVCRASDTVGQALEAMQARGVGSIIVTDAQLHCVGILTRKDIIGKLVLPQIPLSTPMSSVMSSPVHTLTREDTVEDVAWLMARHGFRHVPVVHSREDARLVNIVSERDLYALQRLSLHQVSTAARQASDVAQMQQVAKDIRALARNLVSQGVQAKSLTRLISHLNDVLTQRLVHLMLQRHGLDAAGMCWLSFGSEGRSEQTIATDQDNGLVFELEPGEEIETQRQRWMRFALDVNHALDACGYPLCKGHIMASEAACCRSLQEWQQRFDHWMDHGSPEDLLKANIFFDVRPLAGQLALGEALARHIQTRAAKLPRFLHLLAQDMLSRTVPLDWMGQIETSEKDGQACLDLKLQGTAIFVDAARLRTLALGSRAVNTRERFEAAGQALGQDPTLSQGRAQAFEFLQMLRLRVQMAATAPETPQGMPGLVRGHANAVAVNELSDIDRKLLKESLRVARELQQEMRLDHGA